MYVQMIVLRIRSVSCGCGLGTGAAVPPVIARSGPHQLELIEHRSTRCTA